MSNQAKRLSDCAAERLAQCRGEAVPPSGVAVECAICAGLGDQCVTCEEAEFAVWAERHFAAADYRQTTAGVFVQDWMRHSFSAWQARGAHITRLNAEVSALQQRLNIADQRVCDLQSELTKALSLVRWFYTHANVHQVGTAMMDAARNFIAHQSASAANACSHIWVSADNRGAGAGEICQACPAHRPAAKLDASMIGIVHTPPMEYDEP